MAELMKAPSHPLRTAGRTPPAEVRTQFLAFTSGGETFAMDIRSVREVIQYGGLTEVPLMPPFIRGVINLRGSVVPVIDLGVRLGRVATEVARRTCVVILEVASAEGASVIGIMVDSVNEVLEIAAAEIDPAPSFGHDMRTEFISGVGKVNGRFVILLDVQHVLSVQEMAALAGGRDTLAG
jgi:purine-binding chemotaxis protein CheW